MLVAWVSVAMVLDPYGNVWVQIRFESWFVELLQKALGRQARLVTHSCDAHTPSSLAENPVFAGEGHPRSRAPRLHPGQRDRHRAPRYGLLRHSVWLVRLACWSGLGQHLRCGVGKGSAEATINGSNNTLGNRCGAFLLVRFGAAKFPSTQCARPLCLFARTDDSELDVWALIPGQPLLCAVPLKFVKQGETDDRATVAKEAQEASAKEIPPLPPLPGGSFCPICFAWPCNANMLLRYAIVSHRSVTGTGME